MATSFAALLEQGFEVVDTTPAGFNLLSLSLDKPKAPPQFNGFARSGQCPHTKGLVAYYSNRCPYSEHHVGSSLLETAKKRKLALKVVKLETYEQAQSSPTPATFSAFSSMADFSPLTLACAWVIDLTRLSKENNDTTA